MGNRRNGKTGEADDVTCRGALHGNAVQSPESHDLGRAAGFHNLSVAVERMARLVHVKRAGLDTARQYTAKEVVAIQQRCEKGEGCVHIHLRGGEMAQDSSEQDRSEEHKSELQSLMLTCS